MKHKNDTSINIKLPLSSGEMVLMKGTTQKMWLHSIPKRVVKMDGSWHAGARINITFRKAMEKGGTGNYYNYNVGSGPVYRWNEGKREMEIREDLGKAVVNEEVNIGVKDELKESLAEKTIPDRKEDISEQKETSDGLLAKDIKVGIDKGAV